MGILGGRYSDWSYSMSFDLDKESFAQKIAQQEDSGMYEAMANTVAEEEPKHEVININDYERYWDNSTPNGHQIRILKQDGSTLTINMEWPKGQNPRIKPYTNK